MWCRHWKIFTQSDQSKCCCNNKKQMYSDYLGLLFSTGLKECQKCFPSRRNPMSLKSALVCSESTGSVVYYEYFVIYNSSSSSCSKQNFMETNDINLCKSATINIFLVSSTYVYWFSQEETEIQPFAADIMHGYCSNLTDCERLNSGIPWQMESHLVQKKKKKSCIVSVVLFRTTTRHSEKKAEPKTWIFERNFIVHKTKITRACLAILFNRKAFWTI